MAIFHNLLKLIENSGFYFVPILCIMALFNLRELREWRGKYCFFILCTLIFGSHLIFGGSPRYLFIGLLPCTLLAGAGMVMPVKFLRMKNTPKFLTPRFFMLIFTICTVTACFCRVAVHRHNMEVKELSELFALTEKPTLICSVESSHGMKLAGLLRHKSNITTKLFDSWDSAMEFMTLNQYGNHDIFFFTRIEKPHTPEEFANFFRGKYSIYPFDKVACNNGFLLIKFNGKTLDGVIRQPRVHALESLPTGLPAEKYRFWAKIDLSEYNLAPPGYLFSDSGPADECNVYLRLENQEHIPSRARLALYNELCWQETFRDFTIAASNSKAKATSPATPQTEPQTNRLNDDAPLVLDPSPYFTTRQFAIANCQNLTVLWRYNSDRFVLSENACTNDVRNFTVKDIYLAQSSDIAVQTYCQELTPLLNRKLNILLLEEQYSQSLNIANELPKLSALDSSLERTQVPYTLEGALDSLYKLQLPAKQYDVILVNIFTDAFARPSTVPLQADPAIHRAMDNVTNKLHKLYPQSLIVYIMPPPPTGGYSMFPLANSPQISRLAHYHICSAVERWHRQKQPAQVELVKLYLTLDPQKDYLRYSQPAPLWTGYSFTDSGKKRIAEDIGAFLAYKIQHEEL